MHREHAVEDLWRNKVVVRIHQLDANDDGFGSTDDKKRQGIEDVKNTQPFVINRYHPLVERLDPWPAGLERSFAEAGYDVYNTMNGPSEFTVTGTLKTWDIMDRLPEITVRTLLVGGRYDECTPGHLEEMHRRIAGSRLAIIEDASHLCFAEQPEEFNKVINSFMT